jgi:hypothetical protein
MFSLLIERNYNCLSVSSSGIILTPNVDVQSLISKVEIRIQRNTDGIVQWFSTGVLVHYSEILSSVPRRFEWAKINKYANKNFLTRKVLYWRKFYTKMKECIRGHLFEIFYPVALLRDRQPPSKLGFVD